MADYAATIEGVRALLPHRAIGPGSKPSEGQVNRFLEAGSRWVTARAGVLTAGTPAYNHARTIVELRAAAMAEDAAFPERSGRAGSGYGEVLWERANEALEELLEVIFDPGDPDAGGVEGPLADTPAFSFPEPAWRRSVGT
jgi:hypothetical protein